MYIVINPTLFVVQSSLKTGSTVTVCQRATKITKKQTKKASQSGNLHGGGDGGGNNVHPFLAFPPPSDLYLLGLILHYPAAARLVSRGSEAAMRWLYRRVHLRRGE